MEQDITRFEDPITSFKGEWEFLSNFHPCPVQYDGEVWPTAEHAYVAAKTNDPEFKAQILAIPADKAGAVKRLGRALPLRADWEKVKVRVMWEIVENKFDYNPDMREKLLATGDALLQEGNHWHDNFWGNCTCQACEKIEGKNTLGRLLMTLRFHMAMFE